jgi:hypothetical protein
VYQPSTTRFAPVMNETSSAARKPAARTMSRMEELMKGSTRLPSTRRPASPAKVLLVDQPCVLDQEVADLRAVDQRMHLLVE